MYFFDEYAGVFLIPMFMLLWLLWSIKQIIAKSIADKNLIFLQFLSIQS